MLYSIGASWNPKLSRPNVAVRRALHNEPGAAFHPTMSGLHGLRGLSFADRLNTWGPKTGPAMVPANTFARGSTISGLSSPFTWLEGMLGIEAPIDMATDAGNTLNSAASSLTGATTQIKTLLAQAQGYDNATNPTIQAKAQACEAEAAGLNSSLATLQSSIAALGSAITAGQQNSATLTKDQAQALKDQAATLANQVAAFLKGIMQLQSDVADLGKAAQSGPGVMATLEGAAVHSISTLTWILGGGALIYFLAPTFIPRMIGGLRKARG